MANDRAPSQCEGMPTSAITEPPASGKVTRRDMLALLAAFGVPSTAFAQDPVKIMPKNYRVAFENDVVRVLDYNNRPGMGPCGAGLHYHPRHIDIFFTDLRSRLTEEGKVRNGSAKAGDVMWYEAGTHEVENIDKTASRMFIVEIKDANWKPSTG